MKLILVRHGEYFEDALTIRGVKQAVEAGAKLAEEKIEAIYCSPAKRCIQTLDEILRVRNDNFGIHISRLIGPKMKSEKYEKLKARVELFLDDLKYDHQNKETVLIVCHRAVIEMMLFLMKKEVKKVTYGEIVVLEHF